MKKPTRKPSRKTRPEPPAWPADRVERWPIERLIPYARNARTHSDAQVAQLAASIREWGWTVPVLVDEDGSLIAGHGRILAGYLLKLKTAPTMVARGWTEAQIKAYRIADNQIALNAGWDEQLLGGELDELRKMGLDLSLLAISTDEIERLIAGPSAPGDFPAHDESISTTHECPKCGFRWSGEATAVDEEAA
jgi:ParB-like chromosome segregation protein Spo0J